MENRIAIAKIRTGSYKLAVLTGKWKKTPFEQRLCTLCDMQKIETESHFMFECPYNKLLRETMFQNIRQENNNFNMGNVINQLGWLFSNGSLKVLNNFGQFIRQAFEQKDKV